MSNREVLESLVGTIFQQEGGIYHVQPENALPIENRNCGCPTLLSVTMEEGETEEAALGRLLTEVNDCLAEHG